MDSSIIFFAKKSFLNVKSFSLLNFYNNNNNNNIFLYLY
jgi:hypothetical protein